MAERLAVDFGALVSDPGVWTSLAIVAILAVVGWTLGHVVAQRTGLLERYPDGWSSAGIGLGIGLFTLTAWFATARSGLLTLFAPSALLLVLALVAGPGRISFPRLGASHLRGIAGAWLFLVLTAVAYGLTIAPSPRDGVQPVEFMDEAYYAVLGSQLRATGVESVTAPAGLGDLQGSPVRSWYHWGEAWLGALVETATPVASMQARHLVVLPVLLLASATGAGCFAGAFVRSSRRPRASFLAAFGMMTIAPIPLVLEDHFDWWARPIGFTITLYGMAFVVILLLLCLATRWRQDWGWSQALVVGALSAGMLATHVLVAVTAGVGVAVAAGVLWLVRRPPDTPAVLAAAWRPLAAVLVAGSATLIWSLLAGYGFGERALVAGVGPFDETWWRAIALSAAGGGVLVLGVASAIAERREHPVLAALVVGGVGAVGAGAVLWGIRLADFNSFHLYFGAIAVLLTPVAVAAITAGTERVAGGPRRVLATIGVALLAAQGAIGIGTTMSRLYEFGPGHYQPIPVAALDAIRALPPGAKLAYACDEVEEIAIWDARLISLTAHTGRPVVPMCFQVDVFGVQLRQPPALDRMNPFFAAAPQRALYPEPGAHPSQTELSAFFRRYAIDYVWVDPHHPNTLVPGAAEVFRQGDFAVLRLP